MFRPISQYQPRLWLNEIAKASTQGTLMEFQPFMNKPLVKGCDSLLLNVAQTNGNWSQWLSAEQTAYALGQVTAARALPRLIEIVTIASLLDSRIRLRDYLDDSLVNAIAVTLTNEGDHLQWKQVEAFSYACVIGAGAAACIDTVAGMEILYLRYANQIAKQIAQAQNETELPRSLLGLELNLQESIDTLLTRARGKALAELSR